MFRCFPIIGRCWPIYANRRLAGRKLVLATAADQRVAQAVADFLDLFDEVIASDGERNLKGEAKAAALVARFGMRGFSYVGNDSCDLAVWRAAQAPWW